MLLTNGTIFSSDGHFEALVMESVKFRVSCNEKHFKTVLYDEENEC